MSCHVQLVMAISLNEAASRFVLVVGNGLNIGQILICLFQIIFREIDGLELGENEGTLLV